MPTRTISAELLAQIKADADTFAVCIRITPESGDAVGYTTHDEDLTFDGQAYSSESSIIPTEMSTGLNFGVDNLEISGALNDAGVTEDDVQGGVYDDAEYLIFVLDVEHLDFGKMDLQKGTIGQATTEDETRFIFELASITQKLQQNVGEVTQALCRADLFDPRCKLDPEGTHATLGIPYKFTGQVVASVISRISFTVEIASPAIPAGYFEAGKFIWTDGANVNQKSEVKTHTVAGTTHTITVQDAPRNPIEVGFEFTIYVGCKKRMEDCVGFDNVINKRSEDYLAGLADMVKAGGAQ